MASLLWHSNYSCERVTYFWNTLVNGAQFLIFQGGDVSSPEEDNLYQVTKSRWNLRYMVSILKWATPVFFMRHPVYPCILSMLATENVHCMKYKWKLKSQSIESITLNQASDVLHMNSNNTMDFELSFYFNEYSTHKHYCLFFKYFL